MHVNIPKNMWSSVFATYKKCQMSNAGGLVARFVFFVSIKSVFNFCYNYLLHVLACIIKSKQAFDTLVKPMIWVLLCCDVWDHHNQFYLLEAVQGRSSPDSSQKQMSGESFD